MVLQCDLPFIGALGEKGGRDCGGIVRGATTGDTEWKEGRMEIEEGENVM